MITASKFLSLSLVAIALGGCPKGIGITCPTLTQYSDEFLDRVYAQIDLIEKTAPDVVIMVNDYGVTRDGIRKCIELQKQSRTKKKGLF